MFVLVSIVLVLCFMGYYFFSDWSLNRGSDRNKMYSTTAKESGRSAADEREDLRAIGKAEFATRCVACHGPEGRGWIGPDLTSTVFRYGKSDADITATISEGRPGGMPSFKRELSPKQIKGLVQYIRSL